MKNILSGFWIVLLSTFIGLSVQAQENLRANDNVPMAIERELSAYKLNGNKEQSILNQTLKSLPIIHNSSNQREDKLKLNEVFEKTASSAPEDCGKGAESVNINTVYASLNTYTFADDFVVQPNEIFYLQEIEFIFLKDYNVNLNELFLTFYEDSNSNGPGIQIPVDLDQIDISIDNLGIYNGTIKDIMLLTLNFNIPIEFQGGSMGKSYWAGLRITHQGTQNTSTAAIGTNISQSQTFYVDRGNGWEKNSTAYSGQPPQDLILGFYGTCETIEPACEQPTNLVVSILSAITADISWTAGGTETAWEIKYGAPNFDPINQGTSINVNTLPSTTLTDLLPNTEYQVYVRALCGPSNKSDYLGPVNFTTPTDYDFVYHNDNEQWEPNYPGDSSTATSTILVKAGTATFNTDIVAGDLTVNADANLNVEKILKLHGNNLINNGHITFKSSSVENTAQFDVFNGDITGDGLVTTERFIPARRSFRFLSSAVTTETTIRENWQEEGDNTPGWGTHITGNGGASNGFDPTNTNNPSMFELDDTAQAWVSVENTNMTTLGAGTPYRIMVRGDRNTDLTNNNAEASVTVLRSTGSLKTGNIRFTGGEMEENQYFFIGNPYHAIVNIQQLLDNASNIIQDHYYLWNADLSGVNGRGAYVTVDLDLDLSTPDSNANRFLQPGQAILVRSNGEGPPSVEFKESYKAVNEDLTATFRNATSRIALQLFYQDAFDNEETPTDGISIKFFEEGNNGVDNQDAPKMGNLDENLAILNGDDYLSIESRAYPEDEEIIPLFINNYRKANYVLEGTFVYPPEQTTAYLYDRFTNTHTELSEEGAVAYSFEVDPGIDGSIDSNRFEIHFSVEPLIGVDDITLSSVALYPNPFHDNSFNIAAKGLEGQRLDVQIVNMIGQVIYSEIVTVTSDGNAVVQLANSIASGVYNVKITSEDQQTISKKLMKN